MGQGKPMKIKTRKLQKCIFAMLSVLLIFSFSACTGNGQSQKQTAVITDKSYGVFLSVTDNLDQLGDYETVVIDAQYFTAADIDSFKQKGHKVYTYINVGAIENFRSYFNQYQSLTLAPYENWDEEYWVDVSDQTWQDFMVYDLIPEMISKGVDGFFVDNCDVYYHYQTDAVLDGLTHILRVMIDTGREVILNGGDTFLDAYCAGGSWKDVITGISQESVFTRIDWQDESFGEADAQDRTYFQFYVERYADQGADIYLLEYTTDDELIRKIKDYCHTKGFYYYISDSLELDAP